MLILADDMGFSDLGCYGGEIHTPHLDALAAHGLRFTQFYNTGRCCPTRASLLTGLYPHQAGIGWMTADRGYDGYRGDLNRQCVTIGEVLRGAGYATYAVGKWHVTKATRPEGPKDNWPLQRGFDRFYGTITGAGSFYDPGTLTRDNQMISPFADPEYAPEQYYYTHAITDHAVRFVSEHVARQPDRPFFMYVAYTCAHWPMHALPQDIARYAGKYDAGYGPIRAARLERLRRLGLIDASWRMTEQAGDWAVVEQPAWEARCMEVYAAMIETMDRGIGRIVATLDERKKLDNTLILFLQDNGGCQETVGRRGDGRRPAVPTLPPIAADAIRLDVIPKQNRAGVPTLMGPQVLPGPEDTYIAYGINWANVSNTPYREYKHFVHEGGIATPLIAHWPARILRRNELESQAGHLIDILATCVDVAGAQYPLRYADQEITPCEGTSLVPAFTGQPLARRTPLFWEHEGNRAVRDGKWKLVAKENQAWELYDMERDRTETDDLAAQYPGRVRELAAKWDVWAARAHVLPLGGWRGQEQATKFNRKQLRFELGANDELKRDQAPFVAGRGMTIVCRLERMGARGVLVAQGGSSEGYALFLEQGRLAFATRHHGRLTVVRSAEPLAADTRVIRATLAGDGVVRLEANGQECGSGSLPGPLTRMPQDGLQVGRDTGGAVGEYAAPSAFEGAILQVLVELQPQ